MKKNKSLLTEQFITEWLTPDVGFVFRSGEVLDDFSSPYQHIEVMETAAFGRVFRLDGYLMTSEADEWFYHENLNHIPAITHPDPRSALIIGGGDGGSARQLLKYPSIEQVVVCELDAGVVAIADEYFAKVHQGAFHDPRLQLVIGDGLKYVAESQQQFDLIVLDLTDPQGYAEPLYTRAFFADCARCSFCRAPDGRGSHRSAAHRGRRIRAWLAPCHAAPMQRPGVAAVCRDKPEAYSG
jgi:spermidine synthase